MDNQLDPNIMTHAVREFESDESARALHLAELNTKGFTITHSGLSEVEIDYVRQKIDEIYEVQATEVGGVENLKKINDANIARALAAYDDIFIKIAMLGPVLEICDALLGENYILMSQNGIINTPNTDHYQFTWHRDLNYQHFTSSRPIAISALLCVDPFDAVTGGTYVLEGSHRDERFPAKAYVQANQQVVNASVGDVIVFDSMLFHRTGANRSKHNRRAVNHIITQPFFRQQYSFPHMLGPRADITNTKTRMLLGYEYEPAVDVKSWRRKKLEKIGVEIDMR